MSDTASIFSERCANSVHASELTQVLNSRGGVREWRTCARGRFSFISTSGYGTYVVNLVRTGSCARGLRRTLDIRGSHADRQQPVWESNPSGQCERLSASPNAERAMMVGLARRRLGSRSWEILGEPSSVRSRVVRHATARSPGRLRGTARLVQSSPALRSLLRASLASFDFGERFNNRCKTWPPNFCGAPFCSAK
jgi:hypothetical protein